MGKRGNKQRRGRQNDWTEDIELDVVEKESRKRGRHKGQKSKKGKKHQQTIKAKQDQSKLKFKRGVLSALNDDDDDMSQSENGPKITSRGKQLLKKLVSKGSASDFAVGWHKITVVNAAKLAKEPLLQTIAQSLGGVQFAPICYETKSQKDATFYVERPSVAQQIKQLNGQVRHINGVYIKLNIKTKSSPPPSMTLNEKVLDVIKRVMGNRYRPDVKALDMKLFHSDPGFLGEAVYAPLARSSVMSNVIDIIGDHIPDVEAIDFSDNKLPTLEHFSTLAERAEKLKILYLANNRLSDIKELNKVKCLKLVELNLDGNGAMINKFNSKEGFVDTVQSILPKLQVLDGHQLKKRITFDDEEQEAEVSLPQSIKKMCINAPAEPVILQFIEQYFKLYDADDRSALAPAYHQEALFSVSSAYPPGSTGHGVNKLTDYMSEARNLLRVVNPGKRYRLLRKGREEVVAFLRDDLPKTRHSFDSFTLDVPLATESLSSFTVTGVFMERTSQRDNTNAIRHFSRTFNLVPCGAGFVIVNETLFITMATKLQAKMPFQLQQAADKQNLVRQLVQSTRMKEEWATRCLEQTSWNLDASLTAFQSAKVEGRIPPYAYQ